MVVIGDWIQNLDPTQRAEFGGPRTGAAYRLPHEPTVRRGLQQLDGDALDAVLTQWLTAEEHRVRHRRDKPPPLDPWRAAPPRHLLSALIHGTGQVAGQLLVEAQTNEIPKLQDRREPIDVAGRMVTVDALRTRTEAPRYVVEDKQAHSGMTVKGNQPMVEDALADHAAADVSPSGPHDGPRPRPH